MCIVDTSARVLLSCHTRHKMLRALLKRRPPIFGEQTYYLVNEIEDDEATATANLFVGYARSNVSSINALPRL